MLGVRARRPVLWRCCWVLGEGGGLGAMGGKGGGMWVYGYVFGALLPPGSCKGFDPPVPQHPQPTLPSPTKPQHPITSQPQHTKPPTPNQQTTPKTQAEILDEKDQVDDMGELTLPHDHMPMARAPSYRFHHHPRAGTGTAVEVCEKSGASFLLCWVVGMSRSLSLCCVAGWRLPAFCQQMD